LKLEYSTNHSYDNLDNLKHVKLHIKYKNKSRCGRKIKGTLRYNNIKDTFYTSDFKTINEDFICKQCVKFSKKTKKNINQKKRSSTILRKKRLNKNE
jgi:hypothetical protein